MPLGTILDAAVDSVRPMADARGVTLQYDPPSPGDALLCDPSRIQQVIWNLLTNAVKFTPSGGRVSVTTARTEGQVVIAVADTGAGIPSDFLPYVFDRFRQQDAAITRVHGGLGLGLSIVRHIVELHGGTVDAHSEGEGRGSTFTVTVPVAPLREDSGRGIARRHRATPRRRQAAAADLAARG